MVLVADMPGHHAGPQPRSEGYQTACLETKAGGLRRWQAEQGVLDSGDAGFQRHIGVIRGPEIWPRVFVQMGSWSRW